MQPIHGAYRFTATVHFLVKHMAKKCIEQTNCIFYRKLIQPYVLKFVLFLFSQLRYRIFLRLFKRDPRVRALVKLASTTPKPTPISSHDSYR